MIVYTLTTLYLCIGSGFAGSYLQEHWRREDWKGDILNAFLLVVFGGVFLVLSLVGETFRFIWKQSKFTFELVFWHEFFFTEKWSNLSDEDKEKFNTFVDRNKNRKTIKARIQRLAKKLVNKRSSHATPCSQ
jgi:hypothetical protein